MTCQRSTALAVLALAAADGSIVARIDGRIEAVADLSKALGQDLSAKAKGSR